MSRGVLRWLTAFACLLGLVGTAQAQVGVAISAPYDGTVVVAPAGFTFSAVASNAKKVQFYANGVLLGGDFFAPYENSATLTEGDTYTLTAVATDELGATATDEITITVDTKPTASLTSPASGASVIAGDPLTLAADAQDSDGSVASVSFYIDGVLLGTDTAAPYEAVYASPAVGSHSLTVKATDDLGVITTSTASSLTVTAPSAPPTLTITSPTTGTAVTGPRNVSLEATASDPDGIESVTFYANGVLLGIDTTSPYTGNFAAVTSGSYTLSAVAKDTFSATTTKTVNVTVSAPAGGVSATRKYVYDSFQRLCKVIEPEQGSTADPAPGATLIHYDLANNIDWTSPGRDLPNENAACVDEFPLAPAANRLIRTYDSLNRLTQLNVPGSTDDPTYEYYADGALKKLTNGTAVWDYTYNLRRLPVTETLSYGGLVRTLTHAWNANGFEASLTYPSGLLVNFIPNARGQATQAATYATQVTYHPNGGMSGFKYNACVTTNTTCITHTMTQNARGLPATVVDSNVPAGGNVTTISDTYVYDANGNVLSITDASGSARTRNGMAYDALDRLLTANAPNQAWLAATTGYDALDNIRHNTVGARARVYNYDANNRLASYDESINGGVATNKALTYDVNGNTTTNHTAGYSFDQANRMLAATGKETYVYDGHGRRVKAMRTSDAKADYPFYSLAGQLITEQDDRPAAPTGTDYIYLNGSLVAKRYTTNGGANWTTKYLYTDALGSPVAETSNLAALTRIENYTPYGEVSDGVYDAGPGFTGHVTDAATGLTYAQQRYYDPVTGRFLSIDPEASDIATAWNFNRYLYAGNNPLKFKDPDGRRLFMPVEFVDIHNAVKNSNPELKARLEYLEGDDKVHEIRFLREQPDGMTRVPVTTYAANEGEHGVRADTVTYIDPDAPKYGPPESPLGTPEGVYAHEVGSHVFELATGTSTGEEINPKTGFETKEERANRMERLYLEGAGKKKE